MTSKTLTTPKVPVNTAPMYPEPPPVPATQKQQEDLLMPKPGAPVDLASLFDSDGFRGNEDLIYSFQMAWLSGQTLLVLGTHSVPKSLVNNARAFLREVKDRACDGFVTSKGKQVGPLLAPFTQWKGSTESVVLFDCDDGALTKAKNRKRSLLVDTLKDPTTTNLFARTKAHSMKDAYTVLKTGVKNQLAWRRRTLSWGINEALYSPNAYRALEKLQEAGRPQEEIRQIARTALAVSEINNVNPVNDKCIEVATAQIDLVTAWATPRPR